MPVHDLQMLEIDNAAVCIHPTLLHERPVKLLKCHKSLAKGPDTVINQNLRALLGCADSLRQSRRW